MNNVAPQAPRVPTPIYILRGHASPIHALHLFKSNLRLVSGDANGWVVVWDMVSKRPVAVWKAHDGAVLEVKAFWYADDGVSVVYTHGRDHKLRVWKFTARDEEEVLDKALPVDQPQSQSGIQPWLLHSLSVNALNFCAFSIVFLDETENVEPSESKEAQESPEDDARKKHATTRPALIAVPNALNSGAIDLFHLPLEKRVSTVPAPHEELGMVMAVSIFFHSSSTVGSLYVCSAYENGQVMVSARRNAKPNLTGPREVQSSIDSGSPWKWETLYSSRPHSQPVLGIDVSPSKEWFLSCSADAVLGMHPIPSTSPSSSGNQLFSPESYSPLRTVNTKHAGQQGVRVRSDGKVFATAGWDARMRVYSCKTMKELAVLKWHKEGCFVVAFADVPSGDGSRCSEECNSNDYNSRQDQGFSLAAVQQQRYHRAQQMHWLAAGSKDGKISLWEVY